MPRGFFSACVSDLHGPVLDVSVLPPTYNPPMLPRFLADSLDPRAGAAHLGEDEARHLAQVMRLRAGDEVSVFDGRGREFRARVARLARDGADLQLLEAVIPAEESAVRV